MLSRGSERQKGSPYHWRGFAPVVAIAVGGASGLTSCSGGADENPADPQGQGEIFCDQAEFYASGNGSPSFTGEEQKEFDAFRDAAPEELKDDFDLIDQFYVGFDVKRPTDRQVGKMREALINITAYTSEECGVDLGR